MKENPTERVGIFGGTFNPIHLGHLHLAECALQNAGLDRVIFIPSGISYMKEQKEIVSASHRMEMVKLAIEDFPKFEVSDIEIRKSGNSYSYETISELQEEYPNVKFFFLTGADTIFSIESWKEPAGIFRTVTILAAYRTGTSLEQLKQQILYLKEKYGADIQLISDDRVDISSSEIRNAVRTGKSFIEFVPQKVEAYIEKHNLYREFI